MAVHNPFDGTLGGFAQQRLELGEDVFDQVEVGTIGRQEEEPGALRLDHLAHARSLVAGEVVHDHDVARAQFGRQDLPT